MPANLLKQKNTYFRNLSAAGQERFLERVYAFMADKEFIGREGLVVTDEIKVLIAGSAVQLTFGLQDFVIPHLHTINVFPKVFYSKLYETSFKGLTTQGGVLAISWDDFKDGYADETDKINLGLHELAHALNIDWDEEQNYDDHFLVRYQQWKATAMNEFDRLKGGTIIFFREYATRNLHEFFAVCIEHFFEVPGDFKKTLPVLYGHTVLMLNQDPDNIQEDYRVKALSTYFAPEENNGRNTQQGSALEIILENNRAGNNASQGILTQESHMQYLVRTKGIYLAMAATFIGLFVGVPLLFWFSSVILIDVGTVMLMIFMCGSIGLLQWRFVRDHIDMHYHQFAMYSFTGFGLCFVNFLLFLNLGIDIGTHSETYSLEQISINNNMNVRVGESETSPLAKNLSYFLSDHFEEVPEEAMEITVNYTTGLLGFDKVESCEFR